MEPIMVIARRGRIVESIHDVHAVAVQDGTVVAEAGDRSLTASLRSSAKPLQALSLARAREDLDEVDLAIASASHRAEPEQVEAVRRLLARTGGSEEELECGVQEGRPPEPIYHNCSGKHAGMLAVCRARGWPTEGYPLPDHPLQRELRREVAAAAEVAEADVPTGIDGCGVVCFSVPLERAARAFARLEQLDGGNLIAAAMRAQPRLIGGVGATDTTLMELLPGWIAKGGAEGLMCAAGPEGLGLALKVADGNGRAQRPALAVLLARLGIRVDELASVPVRNSRGEQVGELVAS